MTRLATIALAAVFPLAAVASPLAASPAATSNHYTAQLAAPTDEARAIAGGVVFRCEGSTCTGPRSGDRPLRVCTELRREVGTIASFTINGEPISDDLLARCNG